MRLNIMENSFTKSNTNDKYLITNKEDVIYSST